jgi:hypothetical protein
VKRRIQVEVFINSRGEYNALGAERLNNDGSFEFIKDGMKEPEYLSIVTEGLDVGKFKFGRMLASFMVDIPVEDVEEVKPDNDTGATVTP